MTNIKMKLAAVVVALASVPAYAGKGGSAPLIQQAIASNSKDAIVAEVERTEGLICDQCVTLITGLTMDDRPAVREVAAWWFAKRIGLKNQMVTVMKQDLASGDSTAVRNAADFLGAVVQFDALPDLRAAIGRAGLTSEAKLAIVHAVGYMAHLSGNDILVTAMSDQDASVRLAAINAWRDVLGQVSVTPVESKLTDADAKVRAAAATVIGAYGDRNAVTTLEQLVINDTDPFVRRNAAWALGQIGSRDAAGALSTASNDKSGLVRLVAKASLAQLK